MSTPLTIGLVSISDRASQGVYEDKGLPALKDWLTRTVTTPMVFETRLIADEQEDIEATLKDLVDHQGCQLVLTTGGTGPGPRDVTPEATLAVADRVMPGFGEQMRQISLAFVPTAILSRQVGVIRKQALILNLPGQPKAIAETLEGLKDADGKVRVSWSLLSGLSPPNAPRKRDLHRPRLAARRTQPNALPRPVFAPTAPRLSARILGHARWGADCLGLGGGSAA